MIGESIAAKFLSQRGYKVIDRNFRRPWGEIDIIATKGVTIRFIEVKTVSRDIADVSRENNGYQPEELIHDVKLQKVVKTAELYMANMHDEREYQIDAVAIVLNVKDKVARCRLYEQIL